MAQDFYTLITDIGLAKLANAEITGNKVLITEIAVGDGLNGAYYNPSQDQTTLKHEVWRDSVSNRFIDPNDPNKVIFEAQIPIDTGGWYIREIGAFDADGHLIAISKVAESYKPTNQQGGADEYLIRVPLLYSNTSVVDISIDPAVVLATRQYVDSVVIKGSIRPEGNVTANPGILYRHETTGNIYRKESGTGNTGWRQLNSTNKIYATDFSSGVLTSATLQAAITAIGNNAKTLIITSGSWTVSEDITFPSNIILEFEKGAVLNIATGKTVTLYCLDSPDNTTQIFNCSGTGKVILQNYKATYADLFGAKGDNSTDSYNGIIKACEAIANTSSIFGEGGTVFLNRGTYLVGTSLDLFSNITISGCGIDATIMREHDDLGANPIFNIAGEDTNNRKNNITIEKLTIRNGTATTDNFTDGMDGIALQYVDNFIFRNAKITEIQGGFGVRTKYCKKGLITCCDLYRWTYAGISFLMETEDYVIAFNDMDTAVSTTTLNTYAFSTGYDEIGVGTFPVKNIWIHHNNIKNVPKWEGIDTHGAENIWIFKNVIENCKIAITAAAVSNCSENPILKNCYIKDNICKRGTADANFYGIYIAGVDWNIDENIVIEGNYIEGYGSNSTYTVGSINAESSKNVIIRNNFIKDYYGSGIYLDYALINCQIIGNTIINALGQISGDSYGIANGNVGVFNTVISKNTISYDNPAYKPDYGIRGAGYNNIIIQPDNFINANAPFQLSLNIDYATAPTGTSLWKMGDITYNVDSKGFKPTTYCTNFGIGFYGWIQAATVNATQDTYIATLTTPGNYYKIPSLLNVTIAGAGEGGVDLTTRVTKSNVDGTLELEDQIKTTVTGAAITAVTPTFTT